MRTRRGVGPRPASTRRRGWPHSDSRIDVLRRGICWSDACWRCRNRGSSPSLAAALRGVREVPAFRTRAASDRRRSRADCGAAGHHRCSGRRCRRSGHPDQPDRVCASPHQGGARATSTFCDRAARGSRACTLDVPSSEIVGFGEEHSAADPAWEVTRPTSRKRPETFNRL